MLTLGSLLCLVLLVDGHVVGHQHLLLLGSIQYLLGMLLLLSLGRRLHLGLRIVLTREASCFERKKGYGKKNEAFLNFGMVFLTAMKLCKLRKAHCSPSLVDEDNSMVFTLHSVPFAAIRDLWSLVAGNGTL